jgi:hypothetical protein
MREITKIDVSRSFTLKRLVFSEKLIDKIDRILIYIVFGTLIILPSFMILKADFNLPNQKLISLTIFPLTIFLSLYIVYRTATEKILIELTTQFNEEKNKRILKMFADKNKLIVSRDSEECVILNTKFYRISMVFLIRDNVVLFTAMTNGFRINFPTLIYHLLLKQRLEKEYKFASIDL